MKTIREIEKQYFEIEDQYASKEFYARSKGFNRKEDLWKRKRELNTHAYFLFLFTRLENHIRAESIKLINEKVTNISNWKRRAVWENTDPQKIHFLKRVSLLTIKGHLDYNTIVNYYNYRNTIAHGGTIEEIHQEINMIDVFDDIKRYLRILKK